jgi:V/A-type H+/Na+-transporting ATPase subunit A
MLQRGKEVYEQINILGDDGVPVAYHDTYWKSEVIDFTILQQDQLDDVDRYCSMERQEFILNMAVGIINTKFKFDSYEDVGIYYKRIINAMRQMNFSEFKSERFHTYEKELAQIIEERKVA